MLKLPVVLLKLYELSVLTLWNSMGNFKLEKFHAVCHELLELKYELSSSFWLQQVKLETPQFTMKYYGCSSLLFDALLQRNVLGFLLVCQFIIIYYLISHSLSHEWQDLKTNSRNAPLPTLLKWKSKHWHLFTFIAIYDEGCRENKSKPLYISVTPFCSQSRLLRRKD
jgi:hypothetical protein